MKNNTIKFVTIIWIITLCLTISGCTSSSPSKDTTPSEDDKSKITIDPNNTNINISESNTNKSDNFTSTDSKGIPLTDFDTFTTTLVSNHLLSSPLEATFMFGDLESYGLEHLLSELDDFSYKSFEEDIADAKKILKALEKYPYDTLTDTQKSTYDLLVFQYSQMVDNFKYFYYENAIQPTSGVQINIPLTLTQIELDTKNEVESYLTRIEKLPRLFDQIIEFEEEKARRNLLLPEYMYDLVIEQIDSLLVEPDHFIIYLSFCDKLDTLDHLTSEEKTAYKEKCLSIIENNIYPSYRRLQDSISTYKRNSLSDLGVASWDDGKDYYESIIKAKTSYNLSAEDLRSFAETGLSNCINDYIKLVTTYPELQESNAFSNVLPHYDNLEDIYAIQQQCLDDYFIDYNIEKATEHVIPPYLEEHLASGFYFPLSRDGKDYGNMFLGQSTYESLDFYTLNLYFHENIPGHHLYYATLSNSELPMIRKIHSWLPYEEGWAIYIEDYVYDYIPIDPPMKELFKINDRYSAYLMLLVDISYHYDGKSKDEIIAMLADKGYAKEASENILNRLIANPGEVIHYYYGGYKFKEYRRQCMHALGNKFNIKSFNDMLLKHAGLPFTTMDRIVDTYIKEMATKNVSN